MNDIYTIQTDKKSNNPEYHTAEVTVNKEAQTVVAVVAQAITQAVLYVWHKADRNTKYEKVAHNTYQNRFGYTLTIKVKDAEPMYICQAREFEGQVHEENVSNEWFDGEEEIAWSRYNSIAMNQFPGVEFNICTYTWEFPDGSKAHAHGIGVRVEFIQMK